MVKCSHSLARAAVAIFLKGRFRMKSGTLVGIVIVVAVIVTAAGWFLKRLRTNPVPPPPVIQSESVYQLKLKTGIEGIRTGKYREAIEAFTQAHAMQPEAVGPIYYRGFAYHKLRQLEPAIADLDSAITLASRHPAPDQALLGKAWYLRGLTRYLQKDYARAVADYRQALTCAGTMKQGANIRLIYNNLAWVLATCPDAKLLNGAEAVRFAEKARTLANDRVDPNTLDTLAAAYARVGNYPQAMKTIQSAITLTTKSDEKQAFAARLELYRQRKPFTE